VVTERELEALFARGLHPSTGSRLGRAWRTDGVTGFDLTFSAPKSVSALWALGDSSTAAEAMARTAPPSEPAWPIWTPTPRCRGAGPTGSSRSARPGWWRRCSIIAGSRAGDPQLHTARAGAEQGPVL
jgi:hypothetical protein